MNKLESILITVASTSEKDGRHVIKDKNGNSYSFFETIKSGAESNAFKTFKEQDIKIGSVTRVSISVNGEYKNISGFYPMEQGDKEAPFYSKKEISKTIDETAEGKCRFGFLIEAFKKDKTLTPQLISEINKWVEVSMTGKLENSIQVEDGVSIEEAVNN